MVIGVLASGNLGKDILQKIIFNFDVGFVLTDIKSQGIFEICKNCGDVKEHLDKKLTESIETLTNRTGFLPDNPIFEIQFFFNKMFKYKSTIIRGIKNVNASVFF